MSNQQDGLAVANTIREQIGGRALFMLGAFNLLGDDRSLSFRIRGCRDGNLISVRLDPSDTYTVKLLKVGGRAGVVEVASWPLVYCDELRYAIERITGLATSL